MQDASDGQSADKVEDYSENESPQFNDATGNQSPLFKQLQLNTQYSSSTKIDLSGLLDVNMGYIWAYTLCMGLPTFYTTFALAGNTNTTNVFKAKYGWDEDETKLMNTMISTAGIIGLAIGSFSGGPVLKYGRRKAALITHFIAILGAVVCMFESWVGSLIIGRILIGVAAG